ncbi:MAG TPA: sialidase family protein [Candidatus Dormibacteraeota bacterium]|nr:sialidase family protein [Candidatus Dormibacteraeota bacterium]
MLAAVSVFASFSQAQAASNVPNKNAGEESDALAAAQSWFTDQRAAPNDFINPNAFAAVNSAALALPVTGGAWTERTSPNAPGGVDFTDSPRYIDPTSGFSNSGAGDRYVAGRMTALAVAPGGVLFAGAADGGVWKSTDGGATWAPVFDSQGTLSIGALLVTTSGSSYTVYAGTGEANTSSDSYAGIGVLKSTDGGSTWSQVGGSELNGALIFRLAQDGSTIFAATSHGLYSSTGGTWTAILQPGGTVAPGGNFNLNVGNMISDVAVIPGTGGSQVLAVAGWRGGAPTNGFYLSTDGGTTFNKVNNPQGWVPAKAQGRVTIAYSSDGSRLYAIAQSAYLLNVGTNGKTLLQGVYESNHGPAGPWTKVASAEKLQSSGSAQKMQRIGKGYAPGVQAWYNQFLAVDPANKDHVYLGLEEVYESQNDGASWNTIAPYWNFGFSCFSYSPFEGTCNHNQAHSDQHAAIISNGTLYIGNDGGVYSKSTGDHSVGNWADLNAHLDALQYYSAAGSADNNIYGGLQDNGSNRVFPTTGVVPDDHGNPITVSSVQVFGGDGGYTLVDPNNSQNVITEYVDLTALKSTDGGQNWTFIVPNDPDPRFIAPIAMDRTNSNHLLAGGAIVWSSEAGIAGTTSWQNIFDVRTATGANAAAEVTAIDGVTIGGTQYVAAAWCGACNASFSTGGGFHSGIVFLKSTDGGTTWTVTQQSVSNSTSPTAVAKRYISGVRIDMADPNHAYVTLSGYSRRWMIGPDDPGVGHVFETGDGGATWSNVSGNLPDVPMDDVVFENNNLVVATDFGVFTSSDDGASWSRYGTNLPNVVVDQLTQDPNGNLVAATHGRGIWTIAAP